MLDRLFGDRRQRQELAELKERCAALVTARDQLAQELAQVKAERDELVRQVDKLKEQLSQAQAKVEETQRKAKRPDAPFRRPQRKHNPKKPGRPAGHAPAGRDKPEQVDEEVQVPLQECPHCGGHDLCDVQDAEPQVVIDVPEPVRPTVRRYHNQSGFCRQCKKRVVSRHKSQHSNAGRRRSAGRSAGPGAGAGPTARRRAAVP